VLLVSQYETLTLVVYCPDTEYVCVCVQVCVIEPLCFSGSPLTTTVPHPARDLLLLAMASLSKVLVVTLRPELRVCYVHGLCGDPATLPLLAWHFVMIQLSDKQRVVDPVLAFARDQTIYFVQVQVSASIIIVMIMFI